MIMKKIKRNFVLASLLFPCSLLMSSSEGWSPRILEGLRHQDVIEGRPVIFKSIVDASPEARFECFLKGYIVENSSEIMTSYGEGIALFIIAETQVQDSGDVRFVFTNINGRSSTEAHLTVRPSIQ